MWGDPEPDDLQLEETGVVAHECGESQEVCFSKNLALFLCPHTSTISPLGSSRISPDFRRMFQLISYSDPGKQNCWIAKCKKMACVQSPPSPPHCKESRPCTCEEVAELLESAEFSWGFSEQETSSKGRRASISFPFSTKRKHGLVWNMKDIGSMLSGRLTSKQS